MRLIAIPFIVGFLLSGCSTFGNYSNFEQSAFYGADTDFKVGNYRSSIALKEDPARGVRRFSILTTDEETELFKALERARELHAQLRIYEAITAVAINRHKDLAARTKLANAKLANTKLASSKRNAVNLSSTTTSLNTARLNALDTAKVTRPSLSNAGKGGRENVRQVSAAARAAMNDKIIVPATWQQLNKHLIKQPL